MVSWTKDQEAAIKSRASNLLVSAAAGSGKTAVLVERIINIIIEDKIDIDKLLIVTFTNAAAGEMRERIGKALVHELEKKNENEGHIRRQISLLNKASISTLHSFCIEVVRNNYHFIEIDPNFRIGDVSEIAIMKSETLEELFENEYEMSSEYFHGLVEQFGSNYDDLPLQEIVLKLYDFIQSKPYPEKWLFEKTEAFLMDIEKFKQSSWYKVIKEQINMDLIVAENYLKQAKDLCEKVYGPEYYKSTIIDDLCIVEGLLNSQDLGLHIFNEKIYQVKHKTLPRASIKTDENIRDEVKELREKAKKIIKDIKENILIKKPEEYIRDLNEIYPFMNYLYKMIISFTDIYRHKKNEKGILDFNDLEHHTLRILANEYIAKEYQQRYRYIFIDEYQDSNIVQETIINLIKNENNLFLVGDVKQSIYRFRLADPSLFIEKYEKFKTKEGEKNRRIDLKNNFRSREEIISGVNYIFTNLMSKELGEIDYNEDAKLYKGIECNYIDDPSIEVNIIDKSSTTEDDEVRLEDIEDIEMEARVVANRIKLLLNTKIFDSNINEYRNVNFRDIVILLRTTKNWAQIYLETFTREEIPVYSDSNTGYFEAIEVGVFLNLLKIIDNKRQDIPLLSVLRSPIGGFSTEELIKIRINSKTKTFYDAIETFMKHGELEDLRAKLIIFIQNLEKWTEKSRYLKTDELIWQLLLDTGYYHYVGAMPGGKQRQANLRIFIDRAVQFQNTSMKGLLNFIRFIDKLQKSTSDMGTAKTLGENDNVIRIMSIHKSKGLEFPIVFVGGMGKGFNLQDTKSDIIFHKDLGLGPKYVNPINRVYCDTFAKLAIRNKLKIENLSEEMRILYVAFTRAKDKLIIIGSVSDLVKQVKKWGKNNNKFNYIRANNYLDWICSILTKHKDGRILRTLAGVSEEEFNFIDDDSKWTINLINRNNIEVEEERKDKFQKEILYRLSNSQNDKRSKYYETIINKLDWQYPYFIASKIPSKLSVTNLKNFTAHNLEKMKVNIPSLIKKPKFMEGKRNFTSVEKGIIIHFVMQHLDLKTVNSKEEIENQIIMMIHKELLLEAEAKVVDINKIYKFFVSDLGKRVLCSKKVFREVPFNLVKKACDIIQDLDLENESLLIQGVIDCYFEENDEFILIDYKTDLINHNNIDHVVDKYKIQLFLYKEALEKISNKKVKECYLYLFDIEKAVKIN